MLLLVVPVARLPIPAAELARRVRGRIEDDSVLHDIVTVADGPSPHGFPTLSDWHGALLDALVRGALRGGHFIAPRCLLTVVLVGERREETERLIADLRGYRPMQRLRVTRLHLTIGADSEHAAMSEAVRFLAGAPQRVIAGYEEGSVEAIDEHAFLAEVSGLVVEGLIAWNEPVVPEPVAPDSVVPARVASAAAAGPGRHAPVFHRGGEGLHGRSTPGRPRGSAVATDAGTIDRLAELTDVVSLAHVVFVPDERPGTRRGGHSHHTLALNLDRLLATVDGDAPTGRSMRVAVEVFTADAPLRRHGVLRVAGTLSETDLPEVPVGPYDHGRTVAGLLDAARHTARALRARDVTVVSLHCVFLSGIPLDEADTTGADWDRLLRHARATWVETGRDAAAGNARSAAHRHEPPDISASPYGFHLISDRHDVTALLREESGVLYRYSSTRPAEPGKPADAPDRESKSRLRWFRGTHKTTGR